MRFALGHFVRPLPLHQKMIKLAKLIWSDCIRGFRRLTKIGDLFLDGSLTKRYLHLSSASPQTFPTANFCWPKPPLLQSGYHGRMVQPNLFRLAVDGVFLRSYLPQKSVAREPFFARGKSLAARGKHFGRRSCSRRGGREPK